MPGYDRTVPPGRAGRRAEGIFCEMGSTNPPRVSPEEGRLGDRWAKCVPNASEVWISSCRRFRAPADSIRRPSYWITPYPTGRLFWVAFFQALRARLRSHRPSGTGALCVATRHFVPVRFGHLQKVMSGILRPEGAGGLSPGFQPWEPSK